MNEKATVKYKVFKDGNLIVPVGEKDDYSGEFPLEPVLVFWKACRDIPSLMPPAFLPPGAERSLEGIAKRLIQYEYRNFGDVQIVILGGECKACNTFLTIEELQYDGMCFNCWLDEGQPERWMALKDDGGNELYQMVAFDEEDLVGCMLVSAGAIIETVDMEDCHCFRYRVFRMRIAKDTMDVKLTPVKIHGTWHDAKNPLYIKGTIDGKEVFDGWGTDH
jgi:hypothetical protein